MRHPKIQEAIREEGSRRLGRHAILAVSVLAEIAANPEHKDRLRAAIELLNRAGLH